MSNFTDAELVAFLDESLSAHRSAALESSLSDDETLRNRLVEVRGRQTAGLHTIGAIWRRGRLSCPSRSELGQFILGTLDDDHRDYIQFHLDEIGCRYCQANLDDLKLANQASQPATQRRRKYFQTSAGYLKIKRP